MRIIYNYIFDVSKRLKREEMIPFLLSFFEKNNLKYKEILFKFTSYKLKEAKRATYYEKICGKDLFWNKYKTMYKCDVAKDTYVTGISNLKNDGWEHRNIKEDDEQTLIYKIEEQFERMPKTGCNYSLAFNDISWMSLDKNDKPIMDRWVSCKYPLSSNITLWKDYLQKRYITLNFEMNIKNYDWYVDAFFEETNCKYKKEIIFVLDESEKEKYKDANLHIQKIINEMNHTIEFDGIESMKSEVLHIKQTLQRVFKATDFQWESITNGIYTFYKIDSNNNKIEISFDYDSELKCFGATLTYEGAGYKHSVNYYDMKYMVNNNNIRQYALSVIDEIHIFENKFVPIIVKNYNATPIWFKWV